MASNFKPFCIVAIAQEWCLILSSPDETDPHVISNNVSNFFHIASKSDESCIHYHRDLIFLMEVSMNMSEFGLALDLGKFLSHLVLSFTYLGSVVKTGFLTMPSPLVFSQ